MIIDYSDCSWLRQEQPDNAPFSLLHEMYVEKGTIDDWNLLHELHYKAENLGIGPRFYRCTLHGETIGVGVMTVPKMLSGGRNKVFKFLKPNVEGMDTPLMNRHRAIWMNQNTLTNSRLVIDTMYRGVGAAYRMQNIMMRMTGLRFIEFQSSMSKYNPFAQKAGIQFAKPSRSSFYEAGLRLFSRWFESHPSDYVGIVEELSAMPEAVREKCMQELRAAYYRFSSMEKSGDNRMRGTSRVDKMPAGYLVKSLQQVTLASPLYGVYFNPDFDRELPDRISLASFDRQPTNKPLILD